KKTNQKVYISAAHGPYQRGRPPELVEQLIRPTGSVDPEIHVRGIDGQIDDLLKEINEGTARNERVLVTTLTKRMSEDLTDYLKDMNINVAYLHSEVKTLERIEIIRDLRLKKYDVLVGINLLREGLDIPEVSLVAILDADKEGFLRSERSLIQTMGRAARNENGQVIMYADRITDSMQVAMDETERRREIQQAFNEEHNITPVTIQKEVRGLIKATVAAEEETAYEEGRLANYSKLNKQEKAEMIDQLEEEMRLAAKQLDFEKATELRDVIFELKVEN